MDGLSVLDNFFESTVTKIDPVTKGFSSDKKYIVNLKNGKQYFIKVGDIQTAERKKIEFDTLKRLEDLEVKIAPPIAMHVLESEKLCIQIYGFISGHDGEVSLPVLDKKQQYNIGIEAGLALQKIHTLTLEKPEQTWEEYRYNKYEKYMESIREMDSIPVDLHEIDSFVQQYKHLLKGRSLVFSHGDFHPSNLMISPKGLEAVIDFERYDWEDPYHEYYKMALFSRNISIPFSVGQIHGYFNGEPPSIFWDYYSLYAAMVFPADIYWSAQITPDQVQLSSQRLNQILEDHDYFQSHKPHWYSTYSRKVMDEHV